ncbi:MAG: transcriptional repressor [Planctomycetes bacterium]|nr:transcriptional repressor [Planctomycetota bacterium]
METVEKLTDILRNHGMKITPQRLMIFKVLENNTSHPSAEEVFKRVKRIYPTVSFTTIYKTLETLRDLGEVTELIIDEDRKHYDPNTDTHHHVICSNCKKIHDIFEDFSPHVKLPDSLRKDFAVSGFQISFHGTCKECA